MKIIYLKILSGIIFIILFDNAFADLTCPSEEEVKNVTLIQAMQDPYDPDCWNFLSTSFTHDDNTWNVQFGTFLPGVTTEEEALKQGQAYFDQASLIDTNPTPVAIPAKMLCEYVPNGRSYWISAGTPPHLNNTH